MLSAKDKKIITALKDLYVQMYPSKGLFLKKTFTYSIQDVESAVEKTVNLNAKPTAQKNPTKKQKLYDPQVYSLVTRQDGEQYYFNNMICSDPSQEEKLIKSYSTEELRQIYFVLYKVHPAKSKNKTKLFADIKLHIDNLKRAKGL